MALIICIDEVNMLLKTMHTCKINLFYSLQRHYFHINQVNLKEMNGYSNKRAEHKHCVKALNTKLHTKNQFPPH